MPEMKQFEATENDFILTANLRVIGTDVVISIEGGTHPHVGAVTMLTASKKLTTHTFPSHDGRRHKDGALGENVAHILQDVLQGSATITAGVHFDGISWEGIQVCLELSKKLGMQLRTYLQAYEYGGSTPLYQKLPPKEQCSEK